MIAQAIGDLLPSAVGVALSPVPIVAIVLMLGTSRARVTGSAFAVGWICGLSITVAVVTLLSSAGSNDSSGTVVGWIKLALGALCLALAYKQWKDRPRPGHPPETPGWMTGLDTIATGKAAGLGAALAGANPKNFALSVAAAASVGQAPLSGGETAIALAVFVLIGSLSVAGPVAFYLLSPKRAAASLSSLKDVMSDHSNVIMMAILLILGAKLIGDAIGTVAT